MKKHTPSLIFKITTGFLIGLMGMSILGVDPLSPFQDKGERQLVMAPKAHAWGGSTWRRVRREARRARDRVRRELERARAQAEKEAKRAAVRVREGNVRINLNSVRDQALRHLSAVSAVTAPFLPASQIVQLSLMAIEYDGIIREMEALDIDTSEIQPLRQQLDQAEETLQRLENVRVDRNLRVGTLPPPRESVQSATVARIEYAQVTEYMATLVLEGAMYQHLHEAPNRRPVTLIYKIGQALVDYAQLKKDIELISLSQPEHAGLYQELMTNGSGERFVPMLTHGLQYLETMPVTGEPDPVINASSRVGRLLADVDALVRQGERILSESQRVPLMRAPTQEIAAMNAKAEEITHDPRKSTTAWILLLAQHEIDALNDAKGRLERTRTSLQNLHVYTPRDLVSLYFLQAVFLWPKYQAVPPGALGPEHAVLALEIREIHDHLGEALALVESQRLTLPTTFANTVQSALANLRTAAQDLESRMQAHTPSSSTPAASSVSSASSVASTVYTAPSASRKSAPPKKASVRRSPIKKVPILPKPSSQSSAASTASISIQKSSSAQSEASVTVPSSSMSSESSVSSSAAATALAAPRIMEPSPDQPYETWKSTVTVVGYPDTRSVNILVNGNAISYTPGAGKFAATVSLLPGKNSIIIESIDALGNKSPAAALTVIYVFK